MDSNEEKMGMEYADLEALAPPAGTSPWPFVSMGPVIATADMTTWFVKPDDMTTEEFLDRLGGED
jgi:hypothetical protein